MGAGKTRTAIDIVRAVANYHKRIPKVLVFCPPIVIENWKSQWLRNSSLESEQVTCLYGPGKKRLEIFEQIALTGRGHVVVTNYQSLLMEDLHAGFFSWQPDVVIFDESHLLKDYKSKTSKAADKLVNGRMKLEGPKYNQKLVGPRPLVYLLSGSPILNSAMDIFQQYKILDAGETFGLNFFAFRGRYFRDKNAGMPGRNYFPNWVPKPGAMEELSELMKRNSMRVLKKDCLDLPPLVRQVIQVPMTPEQRKLYNSMLQEYVAYFERDGKEHVATAMMAMTKGLRLMQLASGYIKTVDGAEVELSDSWCPKQDALYSLLEEITPNHKVIIWAKWRKNYEQIRAVLEKLGLKWVEVHGDISDKEKFANVAEFNTNEKCRVLFGNPASGGIGIDLVPASYSIFYSRDFSLGADIQAESRNYRGGSEIHEKVTRIDLVCENSIEEKIAEKLASKTEISESVLREITLELKKGKPGNE